MRRRHGEGTTGRATPGLLLLLVALIAGSCGAAPSVVNSTGSTNRSQTSTTSGSQATSTTSVSNTGSPTTTAPATTPTSTTTTLATTTTLTFTSPISYDDESAADFTATVVASGGHTPSGSVVVTHGKVTLCTLSLGSTGSGTCSPTAKALAPGKHVIKATYSPGVGFLSSESARDALVVIAGPTFLTPAAVTATQKPAKWKVALSATLTGETGQAIADESVVFTVNGPAAESCTAKTSSTGVATCQVASAGQISASGVTDYTATFAGNVDYLASGGSAAISPPG